MAKQKQSKFKDGPKDFKADKEVRRVARDRIGQPPPTRAIPSKRPRMRGHGLDEDEYRMHEHNMGADNWEDDWDGGLD